MMARQRTKEFLPILLSVLVLAASFTSTAAMVEHRHQQADSCLRAAAHMALQELRGGGAAGGNNFAFSPLSLRAALGLVASGASGGTLEEVLAFLGYNRSSGGAGIDALHSDTARIVDSVFRGGGGGGGEGPITSFANGVWVDRSLSLSERFKEIADSVHRAEANSVDFQNKAEEVREGINSWAEKETNGMIKDLLPPRSVSALTRLVLANALYFNGQWEQPFDRSNTFDSEFHLLDGTSVQVPFMTSGEDQYIASFDGFKVLRLPYREDGGGEGMRKFSMYVFLPDERDGLGNLVEKVASDPSFVGRHLPGWEKVGVEKFALPRFRVSWGSDAVDTLKELGLRRLLSGDAEMGELTPAGRLAVGSVAHKAAVEVDEKGTEAAAATADLLVGCSLTPASGVEFVADHPFLFFIMDDVSRQVVFSGHVVNPLVE